jgi:hypothetical protein
MLPDLSSAPAAVQKLAGWLAGRGAQLSVQSFDSPNDQLLNAKTVRGEVQILADRGQWFVELAPPNTSDFFNTAVWTSCLTGMDVNFELEPLDSQVTWMEEFLAGDVSREYSLECLRETRHRRAYGRMGLQL